MSKERVTLRLSEELRQRIAAVKEREGFDHEAEATREMLRRGIESGQDTESAGEQLARIMTGVAGVGAVVATIGAATGGTIALSLAMPFAIATFVFALFWASIRALAGRDLV